MVEFMAFVGVCFFIYIVLMVCSILIEIISGDEIGLHTMLLAVVASIAITILIMTGGV